MAYNVTRVQMLMSEREGLLIRAEERRKLADAKLLEAQELCPHLAYVEKSIPREDEFGRTQPPEIIRTCTHCTLMLP